MMKHSEDQTPSEPELGLFPPTPWGKVKRYQRGREPASALALDELCQIYWKPINYFIVLLGQKVGAAEDLTQGFFEHMLSKRNIFQEARRPKGRLRNLVALAVKGFVIDEVRHQTAIKRGGSVPHISFDPDLRMAAARDNEFRPDEEYDRLWACSVHPERVSQTRTKVSATWPGKDLQTSAAFHGVEHGRRIVRGRRETNENSSKHTGHENQSNARAILQFAEAGN